MHRHLLVLCGAGLSADSGVRTFRDAGGLWEGHRPEDIATPEAWARDPRLVWGFYQERRAQLRDVVPNVAHIALAELADRLESSRHQVLVVTQNVDDLHERAGSDVLHMHGELAMLRCERCELTLRNLTFLDPGRFLPCEECGHPRMRPDIVWFGEVPYHLAELQAAVQTCTHFLAIGTSGVVWPAAGMLQIARERGARTFVQALEPPHNLDDRDVFVAGRAAEVVPELLDRIARDFG